MGSKGGDESTRVIYSKVSGFAPFRSPRLRRHSKAVLKAKDTASSVAVNILKNTENPRQLRLYIQPHRTTMPRT